MIQNFIILIRDDNNNLNKNDINNNQNIIDNVEILQLEPSFLMA